ncbi:MULTISPECIES: PP0621 family protein [unclassified Marinomonas]|uniref:PP0621 family protein n=1 Tax=unclassified Marinomonas TaxID=196814 RepID=UPI0037CC1377
MIVRLIVFIAIFAIGWWLYRQVLAFQRAKLSNKPDSPANTTKQENQESMVRCEQCKTHVPKSHAIHDQDANSFCSKEHLQAFHKTSS